MLLCAYVVKNNKHITLKKMKNEIKIEIENKRKQAIDEYVREEIEQRRLNLLMELMQTAFLKNETESKESTKIKVK